MSLQQTYEQIRWTGATAMGPEPPMIMQIGIRVLPTQHVSLSADIRR